MIIGIPKETFAGEKRVAVTPDAVVKLLKLGYQVHVESGAGDAAHLTDELYRDAGATVVADTRSLYQDADIVLKVQPPGMHPSLGVHEVDLMREGATLIGFIWPARHADLLAKLNARKITAIAMDAVPRISRAQKLDALSSMANIAGYRAIIEAANHFGRFFTGQITAAGKVPPAKVMVIGAGVAGLSAIGAARGLGAVVRAFDTRPDVKDQVKSMGASFLELDFKEDGTGTGGYAKTMSAEFIKAEMELFAKQAKDVDIIVTTALIPGKPAPKLITADMVRSMRQGSVIVDMASEQGGNCELTEPGNVVVKHGVTIIGYTDLPSRLPTQASQLYGNNLVNFLTDLTKEAKLVIDMNDEVVRGATVVHNGDITWPPPAKPVEIKPQAAPVKATPLPPAPGPVKVMPAKTLFTMTVMGVVLLLLGQVAPAAFLGHLTVFVLACFVGWQIIWNVTPALHTPLMSVTNAISGIIVVGAMLQVGGVGTGFDLKTGLAAVAILVATINVAGGFMVTQRMLNMFRK